MRGDFQRRLYDLVRAIPPGRVTTYGTLAAALAPPPEVDPLAYPRIAPRWVGYALARCPDDLPWHRVVNAQGKISDRPGPGPDLQRALLLAEGVRFDDQGRIDLDRYGWEPCPPTEAGLDSPEHIPG